MSSSPSNPPNEAPAADFACGCDDSMRPACKGLPPYAEHGDRGYCVLHFPGRKDGALFEAAVRRKLDAGDFNFCGVWFHDQASFEGRRFSRDANFDFATFQAGANFRGAYFVGNASFRTAFFGGRALFGKAVFLKSAFFFWTTFDAAADFSLTSFRGAADFSFAAFGGRARFAGGMVARGSRIKVFDDDDASLKLHAATVEPGGGLSFHDLRLRPHWFINVDARRFEFSDVDWEWRKAGTKREIECTGRIDSAAPHRMLGSACRDLAVNAEEDHRYEEASRLRYMAMEARRLEQSRGFAFWRLDWWYWLASGYGERMWRAFAMLVGVLFLFAFMYTRVGFARWEPRPTNEAEAAQAKRDETGAPLSLKRALTYSLGVAALQKPEPRPATDWAHALVMLETVLGPLQAALLALAIRRRFMR